MTHPEQEHEPHWNQPLTCAQKFTGAAESSQTQDLKGPIANSVLFLLSAFTVSEFSYLMKPSTRREFIQSTAVLTAAAFAPSLHAVGANDKVVLGIIGPGGMGMNHLRAFSGCKDVEIAYVCDADEKRRQTAAAEVEKRAGKVPKAEKDMRRVLEDKAVEAVVIATPDHWHVPAALLALQAGKHVYVEKPCSHNRSEKH